MSREKYNKMFNKALALLLAAALVSSGAGGCAYKDRLGPRNSSSQNSSTLAPPMATPQEGFKKRFNAAGKLLSRRGLNSYIRRCVEKARSVKGEAWFKERIEEGVMPIPGLLKRTGSPFYDVSDSGYGGGITYIDADVYDKELSTGDVLVAAVRKKADTKTIYELAIRDHYDKERGIPGLVNALEELPFIAAAGVKYIYLLGVMEHSGRPFEIMNPRNIDWRAGSIRDLEAFTAKAHELGLKVCMIDWLANQHVSKKSAICRERPDLFLYTNASDGNYRIDEGSRILRGRDIPVKELRARIETGNKLIERIKAMSEEALSAGTFLEIEGKRIRYRLADKGARAKVHGAFMEHLPIIISGSDALFAASATDLVSLDTPFPHRWQVSAQPDLSHPDVIKNAIEIGRYWLNKGVDGFRVDAALSTFPERIKENWGIEVRENMTGVFIREMRKIKRDCFFLFEGFEKQDELMALAGGKHCGVFQWRCRNFATEALRPDGNAANLIQYLKHLERVPHREDLVNLGPEHDAFNFGDEWTRLGYQDMNILYFIYSVIPGYKLVFDGELFAMPHKFIDEPGRSPQAPKVKDADKIRREVRAKLFALQAGHEQLSSGDYRYLESSATQNAIGVARFDDEAIVIGAFNVTDNSGWANLSLRDIIGSQLKPPEMSGVRYIKENFLLGKDGSGWSATERMEFSAMELYEKGLNINVGPKGCELIVLRKVNSRTPDRSALADKVAADLKNTTDLLSSDPVVSRFEQGAVYEIRYNEKRFKGAGLYIDMIKAYVELLKVRAGDAKNVLLIPSSRDDGLISIRSYKDKAEHARGNIFGEGVTSFSGDLKELRLIEMLDMAFAASNIRLNTPYAQMNEYEIRLVRFIREICRAVTAIDIADDKVLDFIRDLPTMAPLPIDYIEEYNRLVLRKLLQSA